MREAKTPYIPDYFHHVLTLTMQCRWYIKVTWPCFCGIRGVQRVVHRVTGIMSWEIFFGHGKIICCWVMEIMGVFVTFLLTYSLRYSRWSQPLIQHYLSKHIFFKISIFSWWQTPLSSKCYMYLSCTIRKILVIQVMTAVRSNS